MSEIMDRYDAAMLLHETGNTDEAIVQLEAILGDDPDFLLAHNSLAVFYQRGGDTERAIIHASRVCDLDPGDAFSYTGLSIAAIAAGQTATAEEAKARAEEIQWAEIRRRFEEENTARKIADEAAAYGASGEETSNDEGNT